MGEAANEWIAEVTDERDKHNISVNLVAWAKKYPDATFGVIQTILELTANNESLFILAAAGPLESFLSECSDDFANCVCAVARIDPQL